MRSMLMFTVCLFGFFFNQYILHSISSLLLIDFNFNDSRNKCSFSFQSEVSINVQSTASSLYFCLSQTYCALFCVFSFWLFVCILYIARSLPGLNFALESSTNLFLFYSDFEVNIYPVVFFFRFMFVSYVRIQPLDWLIVTLISSELFTLFCLIVAFSRNVSGLFYLNNLYVVSLFLSVYY